MNEAETAYRGMTESQRRRLLLVEYFCAQPDDECRLLRVWRSLTLGAAFYQPAYVLTDERNLERSTAEGRARHTTDGGGRWTPTFGRWAAVAERSDVGEDAGFELHCRHTDVTVSAADIGADIRAATPGRPVRRYIACVSSPDLRLVALNSVTQDQ